MLQWRTDSQEFQRQRGRDILARCQLFSGLESKQSRLELEKTPEECFQDRNEIDRLPDVFEFIKRRQIVLLESLRLD